MLFQPVHVSKDIIPVNHALTQTTQYTQGSTYLEKPTPWPCFCYCGDYDLCKSESICELLSTECKRQYWPVGCNSSRYLQIYKLIPPFHRTLSQSCGQRTFPFETTYLQLSRNYPATVFLLPVVGRSSVSLASHSTKLGLLLASSASRSTADAICDSTPPNEAHLPLDIPLVEAVSALERQSFWLLCLLPLGRADFFFCHWLADVIMT
jgi:hypothetical protein